MSKKYTVSSVLLSGSSCPKCSTNKNKQKYTYSTETFISKAKKIHNSKYDYSKVDYKGEKEKIIIICPEHGEFIQEPNSHLSKHGCPKCGNVKKYKTNEAIQMLKNKIGDKYDYSKVEYINARTKLDIICNKHGVFKATLNSLLNFHGCPKCKESVSETKIRTILDKTNIKYEYQKRFNWLNSKSLDFYLPEYNIAIECQGIQHFKNTRVNWETVEIIVPNFIEN